MTDKLPPPYGAVLEALHRRLGEAPSHRVQLLTGPRQVGKTTLLAELGQRWFPRALCAAADAPEAALPGWWDYLWLRAQRLADEGLAVVLLDEVQYMPGWSRLLKSKADDLKRRRRPVQVVATGSLALSLGEGSCETMAGRFERLRLLHWPAAELAQHFGKGPETAARDLVRLGGYSGAVGLESDFPRWRAYVRDSILEPAIGRDLMATQAVRRPAVAPGVRGGAGPAGAGGVAAEARGSAADRRGH